ncbi:MAG: electron transporter RnfE [Gallionellales bacterium CG03_land_8_20_14_0_80_55_15]|nr:MAG: electron transporter RnfE [Gallionellales bacterium CG03_land_8_20_14_0_80_55_15]PIV92253.1 MAG: electron transporter RnfE [Gallionellales bacterium CG17_big_fil_post_rev_8_21_14_2_50_54_146]PIX03982.1 MAG: electron transporter RnfE [Gallionellales bacterium CG_4_8_14_3_um_filter_54_18]PJC03425.1 MAG: electron transporter RnfE [Gallionellales bacterium CG_4_9_14_0_8_um_filter_55_61]
MWWHMGGWGMGYGMLLFWGLLVAAIVILARCARGSGDNGNRKQSALDLLNERYARGEIEREEFEQKKRDLQS